MIDRVAAKWALCRDHAAVWNDGTVWTYGDLLDSMHRAAQMLDVAGVGSGTVLAIEADHSGPAIAVLVEALRRRAIVVPLSRKLPQERRRELAAIAGAERSVSLGTDGVGRPREPMKMNRPRRTEGDLLYRKLRKRGAPGVVLFSSGTSGEPKAALHDANRLLARNLLTASSSTTHRRLVQFLLFDHIGGLNTLFHTIATAGTAVIPRDLSVGSVVTAVVQAGAQILPTSPTFLNLLLLSGVLSRTSLPSLELVTYGTEPMTQSALDRLVHLLPHVRFKQTYGLSELGIVTTVSRANDSLWIRLGGGVRWRVADGTLELRTEGAMLGYLNAPSPFTEDGWFRTNDVVDVDGEWLHVLGRTSEVINVGGRKVIPIDVEAVLMDVPGIDDVVVYGLSHPFLGEVVAATVRTSRLTPAQVRRDVRHAVADRLEGHQMPVSIQVTDRPLYSHRLKRLRKKA